MTGPAGPNQGSLRLGRNNRLEEKLIKRIIPSQLTFNLVSGALATGINLVVVVVAYLVYLHFLDYDLYGVWLVLGTVLIFA